MAIVTLVISLMGLSGWTPVGRLPDIGYTWTNGSFQISLRLGSAFLVPLAVSMIGLVLIPVRMKRTGTS